MNNCTITRNEQFNSYEIDFDGKPAESVRDMLKANGYRWHGKRGIWYGYKDITEQLNGADMQYSSSATPTGNEQTQTAKAEQQADKAKQAELLSRYMEEHARIFGKNEKYDAWLYGQIARIIELDNGEILAIDKPRIKTDFCFGYGYCGRSTPEDVERAQGAEEYARTNADYFIRENLEQLTRTVDVIKEYIASEQPGYIGTIPRTPYIGAQWEGAQTVKCLTFMQRWDFEDMRPDRKSKFRQATEQELQRILTAYEIEIKAFEKRLQAYLKRYGLTKLHTWTYLSD